MNENLARRCSATAKGTGERCGRAPILGGSVCALHGGRAPQTVAAARARLLAGVDLALDYLLSMLEPRLPCPTCGRSDADRDPTVVRAAQIVLDRAGLGPSASLTVTPATPEAPWAQWLTDDQLVVHAEMIEDAKRRMLAGEPRPEPGVLLLGPADAIEADGDLVPDDDEDDDELRSIPAGDFTNEGPK